jgi:hypothetical protein
MVEHCTLKLKVPGPNPDGGNSVYYTSKAGGLSHAIRIPGVKYTFLFIEMGSSVNINKPTTSYSKLNKRRPIILYLSYFVSRPGPVNDE